jgi:hypothetical protein
MPSERMIPLLALQARDLELRKAERSLGSFPVERSKVEAEREAAEKEFEDARSGVKAKEVERERLEADAEAAREKIRRLRNQQLEVRKNDAYEALTHEIQALEESVDRTEERELALLDEIDAANQELAGKRKETEDRVEKLDRRLGKIEKDEESFRERLAGLRKEVEEKRGKVDPELLSWYDSLWRQIKRPPVVVPLEDQKCGGCHLRVSNEIDADVHAFKPVACDQCGRLLYLE